MADIFTELLIYSSYKDSIKSSEPKQIQILDSTRNRLKMSCRKDQTYDDKIRELLDQADNK
jgi:uncharacterized protein (UPF0262 family)